MYYDDSDEDMEDFQMHPKKMFKMMEFTKVCFIIGNRYVIHTSHIFLNKISMLNSGIWLNINIKVIMNSSS
jgi:hypothetical protein